MISSTLDRIDFVGLPPFLRIILGAAMETMHFHIAKTKNNWKTTLFRIQGAPNEQFGIHEKLYWVVQGNLNWMPCTSVCDMGKGNI